MHAIYFKDANGEMFPCTSSKRMIFTSNLEEQPALFAQAKNAETALKQYKKYCEESGVWRGKARLDGQLIAEPGNLNNYYIVPMKVFPQYEYAYQLPVKRK